MSKELIIILSCILVTIPLRLLPFYFNSEKPFPKWIDDFLSYVPYTAIGALTIPGVIDAAGDVKVSVIAFAVVLIISFKRGGMTLPIISGVGTAIALLYIL